MQASSSQLQDLRAAFQTQSAELARSRTAQQSADSRRAESEALRAASEAECHRLQRSLMYAWNNNSHPGNAERSADSVAVAAADAVVGGAASAAPALPAP